MNAKERLMKTMDRVEPDRVPFMCQMSIGHMLCQTGYSPSEFWFSSECFAEGLLQLRQLYGFDGILISLHGHSPEWAKTIDRIEKSEEREVVHWKNGDKTLFPYDDLPLHVSAEKKMPPSLTGFAPEAIQAEIAYIPVSQGISFHFDMEHKFDIIDAIADKVGTQYSIHGEVTSPFDYFLHLFGISEAMIHLVTNPQKSKAILQRYADGVRGLALEMTEHGVDAIKISSPFAGSGFISPRFYRDFVLPYEKQIAQAVRKKEIHVYTHTCGAVSDRLEMMVETGISGLECLDPPPLGDVDLEEAKKRIGSEVFIKGNIDPINVLLKGTPEAIRKDAEEKIGIGKPGGGFILSSACSIAPHTRKEHIQILGEVVESAGLY